MGRVRRVVAANVQEDPDVQCSQCRERPVEVVVGELVATRAEDARRGIGQRLQEVRRLPPQIDVGAGEQSFDAVPQANDGADPLSRIKRLTDDPEQRSIDDGGRPARLTDDECPSG
jgi:hypothetical protein